jgi:hypothetical protein
MARVAERWTPGPARARGLLPCLALGLIPLLGACAGSGPVVEERPLDAGQLAMSAERASALDAPYRIVFDWALNEPGRRLQGQGVARIEPPYRARLDLFARNGERVAVAALVDSELRLLGEEESILPPPSMLWGALGVFRAGRDMGLAGGSWRSDGGAELRYIPGDGSELLVRLRGSRIQEMLRRSGNSTVEELRVSRANGERFPREANYRDLVRTRELRMTLESVEHVESFPTDIWTPRR